MSDLNGDPLTFDRWGAIVQNMIAILDDTGTIPESQYYNLVYDAHSDMNGL